MGRIILLLFLLTGLITPGITEGKGLWTLIDSHTAGKEASAGHPRKYLVYSADEAAIRSRLFNLSVIPEQGVVLELPMPGGTTRSFKVWRSSLIPDALAAKYPQLQVFTAVATDNPLVTAKLDFTVFGFHAMIYDDDNTALIDPADNTGSALYTVHYKRDEVHTIAERPACQGTAHTASYQQQIKPARKSTARVSNGSQLFTYRLALSCDNEYAQAATGISTPTIAQALSTMTTSMNRINGVYERELSVTMNFVTNEDALIWTTETGSVNGSDPFSASNSDASSCNIINQTTCDKRIGNDNYDIGHVFTTGAGGYSQVGVVCQATFKAQSSTGQPHPTGDGFDIDYVAHEMGHEFGADHPFNNNDSGSCRLNAVEDCAYEPGSGSTIMAYAGICQQDDLQPHSDAYFHGISLLQIQSYITDELGNTCPVKTPTNNKLTSVQPFSKTYIIPYLTPFELLAPTAIDSVGDTSLTYCWEQWNLGDFGSDLANTHTFGPIFRSFPPVSTPLRVFPKIDSVLVGSLNNSGYEYEEGEKVPDVARFLTFRLTVRDIYQGNGCFLFPDDSILLDVVNMGAGFAVTSQNTKGAVYNGNSTQTVTWNVVQTNTLPINTQNVDIYMSADGGYTWPYHIGQYINNGSASVTLPNPDTTISRARIKVKGSGNVFFNVNGADFSVLHSDASDTAITIRPVPVRTILRVSSGNKGLLQAVVYNVAGQKMWSGQVNGELDISVQYWATGMYFIKFIDSGNHKLVKKFVVE